eukprot:3518800-Prymnesium_polylepis.1
MGTPSAPSSSPSSPLDYGSGSGGGLFEDMLPLPPGPPRAPPRGSWDPYILWYSVSVDFLYRAIGVPPCPRARPVEPGARAQRSAAGGAQPRPQNRSLGLRTPPHGPPQPPRDRAQPSRSASTRCPKLATT